MNAINQLEGSPVIVYGHASLNSRGSFMALSLSIQWTSSLSNLSVSDRWQMATISVWELQLQQQMQHISNLSSDFNLSDFVASEEREQSTHCRQVENFMANELQLPCLTLSYTLSYGGYFHSRFKIP